MDTFYIGDKSDYIAQDHRHLQGCHGQGKYLEIEILSRSVKSRGICGWPGKFRKDLESQGKFREFVNIWLWQAVFRKFVYFFKRGKDVNSHEIV